MNKILEFLMGVDEDGEEVGELSPSQIILEHFVIVRGDYTTADQLYVSVDDLKEFFSRYEVKER